ncbi:hypothetical protein TNIN_217541 [Trichonephila inaurata madagascariensis]|uniref:Uncharacterized protein n=1 Tax=Trichonephila inaurata madagascariensis TaxID=2747483 RepID=A0A8X7CLD2_9ARAC|nr:hypothetical protein TNIN_217541 [Trichonephila inaurata madagascariensis]
MDAPILPIPNIGVAAVHTLLYVVLHCRAGLLHCPLNPDVYPERHVVPVALCGYCSAIRNKVVNNDIPDVIREDYHQFD